MAEGLFGDAQNLSRAKNTSVERMRQAGIIEARGGKARLRSRVEYDKDWDPSTDDRLTIWACAQRIIAAFSDGGVADAARIVAILGGGTSSEVHSLAYRLYAICDRRGWTEEAIAYNDLVSEWPSIQEYAQSVSAGARGEQARLGL